jgi:hypothetical protein
MTGPSLAPLIIPIAGTLFLTAWLTLVFYAGRCPRGGRRPSGARPRKSRPGRAGCPRLPGAPPTDAPDPANTRHSRPQRVGDVRVIFEVER